MALDWDKLRVFHAAAEAGSFTHAAETLKLSQSAISRQVSAPKRSFHLVEIGRHRRLSSLLDDAHAWLYRLGGKAPPRRLRGAIDS